MTAQPAATTVPSVEAPDSMAPRSDPAEACGTLTILVEVTVTTAALGTVTEVSPAAGLDMGEGVIVTVLVNGTEMCVAPDGPGVGWRATGDDGPPGLRHPVPPPGWVQHAPGLRRPSPWLTRRTPSSG